MAQRKRTTAAANPVQGTCVPRECLTTAGHGPCPHGVHWAVQKAGATWQGWHRTIQADGTMSERLEGGYAGKISDLKAGLQAAIRAHMAAEYPAIEGEYLGKIVNGLSKTLREDAGWKREHWQDRYAFERALRDASVKESYAPYLASYLLGAEKAAEILYPSARKVA